VRTAAVLPVKRFALAKQRLGETVEDPFRRALAEAMVSDVLDALVATDGLHEIVVVTNEASVADAAAAHGARIVPDEREAGQSPAAAQGIERAVVDGAQRVLLVPGDCPALDPRELETLLASHAYAVVIVPDRHDRGTNALLLAPPDVIEPSFGEDSRRRHEALAAAAGASARLERPASLLLDIDTGEDLRVLRDRLAAGGGRAPRTRAVLDAS